MAINLVRSTDSPPLLTATKGGLLAVHAAHRDKAASSLIQAMSRV